MGTTDESKSKVQVVALLESAYQTSIQGFASVIGYDDGQSYHTKPEELVEATSALDDRECQGLETEVKKQIQQLDAEIAKMQADRDGLAHILNEINNEREMERQRQAALEAARIAEQKRRAEAEAEAERAKRRRIEKERKETERSDRGKYIDFNLHESDYVQQNFGKTVTSMAMGGTATVMLYEDGDWMYTAGLPKLLHNKLKGRAKHHPSPVYVAVGSQDRYYIKFSNGKSEWVGCDDLTEELNSSSSSKVKSVAFGEEWDSYFVVYTDGGYAYQSVPSELVKLIKKRIKADLSCVSLGPDGEYYVGAEDGRAWWGGMHADNLSIAGKVKDRIKFMDFGDDDSFFFGYSLFRCACEYLLQSRVSFPATMIGTSSTAQWLGRLSAVPVWQRGSTSAGKMVARSAWNKERQFKS
ncbi:hypothetical protein THAOC_09363 [Thalassiosira oceanica]|uniref:Uncharacterized protein n=1 Tax=Thalassiosira oceanica TaxID=159749 RepID=K0SVC5_THAOC|nr:hypothetical protein THAOC_09363 [Thalassiosira oceanica]|eukprot:EJK69390.1 hypothetical protein THAOC_09363 [Thalassiosira oceanica]